MELHNRLVHLRKERHLSQEELAEKLYVSRQTISNWERGKTYPDINSLLLIATFFDVSLDNLIKGDVDMMKHQVKQSHLKKWLMIAGCLVFVGNFLQPIGRFYKIPNFKLITTAFVIGFVLSVLKIYNLARKGNLKTYSQIIGFIVASSQFFSERKMRKPPAMLVVAEASSFHLFFLV